MRLNPSHKLQRIGNHCMIVDVCTGDANLTNVYVLNDTATFLWESVTGTDFDASALVKLLCDNYDVDAADAAADVDSLLQCWRRFGIIDPSSL